jgi:hypothetical protein
MCILTIEFLFTILKKDKIGLAVRLCREFIAIEKIILDKMEIYEKISDV